MKRIRTNDQMIKALCVCAPHQNTDVAAHPTKRPRKPRRQKDASQTKDDECRSKRPSLQVRALSHFMFGSAECQKSELRHILCLLIFHTDMVCGLHKPLQLSFLHSPVISIHSNTALLFLRHLPAGSLLLPSAGHPRSPRAVQDGESRAQAQWQNR